MWWPKLKIPTCYLWGAFVLMHLVSCTTHEEIIQRERVKTLSQDVTFSKQELQQTQSAAANMQGRLEEFRQRLEKETGIVEEKIHELKTEALSHADSTDKRLLTLEHDYGLMSTRLSKLEDMLKAQTEFLKQVNASLAGLLPGKKKENSKSSRKEGAEKSSLQEALALYQNGKFALAEVAFEKLLRDKNRPAKVEERLLHNLGMARFFQKKYSDSMVAFSKLYTKNSASPYAASSLLHIGKIFQVQGKITEAQASCHKLQDLFPKSNHVAACKELLKKH